MQCQKIRQGGGVMKTFIVNNVIHIGLYGPLLSSNLTQGIRMLLKGARGGCRTSIPRETFNNL